MKILVVQNRMGIGDAVIFLPFIEAISKKFGVPVTCLIKKSSKANEIFNSCKFINDFPLCLGKRIQRKYWARKGLKRKKNEGLVGSDKR